MFTRTREFIQRYSAISAEALDVITVWSIGTWTFSPACTQPATYPYLYISGAKGSGKTVLGQDVLGCLCRMHTPTVGITGAGVFRLMGDIDTDTGDVITVAPTLALDEIDATYNGAKDEHLRQMLNAGYKRGATVPRTFGRQTYPFPVFGPKLLMGIDNGHLPDTITDRCIRIDIKRAHVGEYEPFYSYDIEDEAPEIQQQLADWCKENSLVLREYRPEPIPNLEPRAWGDVSRPLVQLAHALGVERRIREALAHLLTADHKSGKRGLYQVIFDLFSTGEDRLATRQIMEALGAAGIHVPGDSGKGLSAVLSEDGIAPTYIRFPIYHPGVTDPEKPVQRGYFRHQFDGAFVFYLKDDE